MPQSTGWVVPAAGCLKQLLSDECTFLNLITFYILIMQMFPLLTTNPMFSVSVSHQSLLSTSHHALMLPYGCPSSKVSDLLMWLLLLSLGSGKECLCWMGALGTSRLMLCLAAPQLLWWHTGHRSVSSNELREKQEHTSGVIHRADFIHFLPPGSPICPARPSRPGLAHVQALPLGRAIDSTAFLRRGSQQSLL